MAQPDPTVDEAPEGGGPPRTAADLSGRANAALTEADDIVVAAAGRPDGAGSDRIRELIALKRDPWLLHLATTAPTTPVSPPAEEALQRLEAAVQELAGYRSAPEDGMQGSARAGPDPARLDRFAAWFDGDADAALAGAAASAQRKRDAAPAVAEPVEGDATVTDMAVEPLRDQPGPEARKPADGQRMAGRGRLGDLRTERRPRGLLGRLVRLCALVAVILAIVVLRDSERRNRFSEALDLPRLPTVSGGADLADWAGDARWGGSVALAVGWLSDDIAAAVGGAISLMAGIVEPDPADEAARTTASEVPGLRGDVAAPERPGTDLTPVRPEVELPVAETAVGDDHAEIRRRREVRPAERVVTEDREKVRLRREVARLTAVIEVLQAQLVARSAGDGSDRDLAAELARERARRTIAEARLEGSGKGSGESARKVAALNAQVRELGTLVAALQAQVRASEERELADRARIAALSAELNTTLARQAAMERAERERLEEEARRLGQERETARNNPSDAGGAGTVPEREEPEVHFVATHRIGDSAANARGGPGTGFSRVAVLRPGTPLALKREDDGWGLFAIEGDGGTQRNVWVFLRLTRANQ